MNRSRREAQAALTHSVADLQRTFEESLASLETKLLAGAAGMKQELQVDKEERRRTDVKAINSLEHVQAALRSEQEARATDLQQVNTAIAATQASVELERTARQAFQDKMYTDTIVELGAAITEEHARREHDILSLKDTLGKASDSVRQEGLSREKALEDVFTHIKEAAAAAETQMKTHQVEIENRLETLGNPEGLIHELIEKERGQRKIELTEMATAIDDVRSNIESHVTERNLLEERLLKSVSEAEDRLETGRSALEEKLNQQEKQVKSVQQIVEEEKVSTANGVELARKDRESLREALENGKSENKELCRTLSIEEAGRREEGMREMRQMHTTHGEEQREWARLLIGQLSSDLRAEHEALTSEQRRRNEEFAHEETEKVKAQVMAEVSRIQAFTEERARAQEAAMGEDKAHRETEAQHTATEVRDCLTSHSDFMEALEREQQILINRLNEGLALEDQRRDGLGSRLQAVELDMQKVRGHLPILFAVPTAFR
jgi:hypothetical protein